jgi:hypothetical protein
MMVLRQTVREPPNAGGVKFAFPMNNPFYAASQRCRLTLYFNDIPYSYQHAFAPLSVRGPN